MIVHREYAKQLLKWGDLDGLRQAALVQDCNLPLPTRSGSDFCEWRIPEGDCLFQVLNRGDGLKSTLELEDLLRLGNDVGQHLYRLHQKTLGNLATGLNIETKQAPVALTRVARWLRSEDDHVVGVQTSREELEDRLGALRVANLADRMEAVCSDFAGGSGSRRILHGGAVLANFYVGKHEEIWWRLLTGPEVCIGPPEYDWGMLLGELAEITFVHHVSGETRFAGSHVSAFARSILEWITGSYRNGRIVEVMLARILLHLLDFSTFVGPVQEWEAYVELLRFIDEVGYACFEA